MVKRTACLALALLLGGCTSASGSYVRAPAASAPLRSSAPASTSVRAAQVMRAEGLGGVIGAHASALTGRFGEARIDLAEGDARKLQFASSRCVLDIFLYPPRAGTAPVATHVEARERQGGRATDRAHCIAEVEQAARG